MTPKNVTHPLGVLMTDDLRVESAAINQDGTVHTLPPPARHTDVLRHMTEQGVRPRGEQGFVLSDGRFVLRRAALQVARKAEQLLPGATPYLVLLSSDVW